MEWTNIVNKHWSKVEEAAQHALNSMVNEFRENGCTQELDDDFKQLLLSISEIGVNTSFTKFIRNINCSIIFETTSGCESSNGHSFATASSTISLKPLRKVVYTFRGNQPTPFNTDALQKVLEDSFNIEDQKHSKYDSSADQYHKKKSETSASTVDSGCPSTSHSTVSRSSVDSSVSNGEISNHIGHELSGSLAVDETASYGEHQNASDTLIAINSVLESNDIYLLAGRMCSDLDGCDTIIDLTKAATISKLEDEAEHKPEQAVNQSTIKLTNKRKIESESESESGENSSKKMKVVDTSIGYKCQRCEHSFSRQASLKSHIKKTGHWYCEICCEKFETEHERNEHKKMRHEL